jgi:hypothetical protein
LEEATNQAQFWQLDTKQSSEDNDALRFNVRCCKPNKADESPRGSKNQTEQQTANSKQQTANSKKKKKYLNEYNRSWKTFFKRFSQFTHHELVELIFEEQVLRSKKHVRVVDGRSRVDPTFPQVHRRYLCHCRWWS